jgi:hypothetical protein
LIVELFGVGGNGQERGGIGARIIERAAATVLWRWSTRAPFRRTC